MHYVLAVSVITLYIYFRFGTKALAVSMIIIALLALTRGMVAITIPLLLIAFYILKQTNQFPNLKLPRNRKPGSNKFPSGQNLPPKHPTIRARFLELYLDDNTGDITGQVIRGTHIMKPLENLKPADLKYLVKSYHQTDKESEQLLLSYISVQNKELFNEIKTTNWQHNSEPAGQTKQNGATQSNISMSRLDASLILGLGKNPAQADIKSAHRKLMKKFHPDQGGSQFLATKINMAKDLLLK